MTLFCSLCFTDEATIFQIEKKLQRIINNIIFKTNIKEPSGICAACYLKLETTNNFIKECKNNRKQYLKHFGAGCADKDKDDTDIRIN